MKKQITPQKIRAYANAYPVFIMHEQLNLNGFFESGMGLDEIWDLSCVHYEDFLNSSHNDEDKSEYDCIVEYVRELMKFYVS